MKRLLHFIVSFLLVYMVWTDSVTGQHPITEAPTYDTLTESGISFNQLVVGSFIDMYEKGIPEKLYLHLDKPYYSAGDHIYFKGYLVNAVTLKPMTLSNYIYVELIDKKDTVVERIKIKADEFGFHNSIKLEPDIPAGEYVLRAYTRWMENEDPEFFYKRVVQIGNKIDDGINTDIFYTKEEDGHYLATIKFKDHNLEPITGKSISYTLNLDRRSRKTQVKTDDDGILRIRFQPSGDGLRSGFIQLKAEDPGIEFERTLYLPAFSEEYDLHFFPEGGHLLPVGFQNVAFKAIGSNGMGIDIAGNIYNQKGEHITAFKSEHKGMGKFVLNPQPGEHYHAKVQVGNGNTVTVNLPPVEMSGCAISAMKLQNYLICRIHATDDINLEETGLIMHVKGQILVGEETEGEAVKMINLDHVPPGIAHLALVHIPTGRPLSERLFFIRNNDPVLADIQMQNLAADLRKSRHKITLDIHLLDKMSKPVNGSFSMSVTDNEAVLYDSLGSNIYSELLLNSDLKGNIEEPGYYFIDNSKERDYKLDLLMLTQGWKRFELFTALKRETDKYRIKAEDISLISGRVSGVFGKAPRKSQIVFADAATNDFELIELNKTGEFSLLGFELTDTSSLLIQALNKHGEARRYTLEVDQESFPLPKAGIPTPHYSRMKSLIPDNYLELVKQTYYDEGGMRIINIPEITVSYAEKEYEEKMFDGIYVSKTMNQQDLSHYRGQSIGTALGRLGIREATEREKDYTNIHPHFQTDQDVAPNFGSKVYIHQQDTITLAIIDGVSYDLSREGNILDGVRVDYVDVIGFIPKRSANLGTYGYRANGGAIVVRMKKGEALNASHGQSPSLVKYDPLGVKTSVEFYQPRYDVAEELRNPKPDRRTTIYWNPKIQTDESGRSTVSFYTSDRQVDYDIVLEGVDCQGKLCRYHTIIPRSEKISLK